MAIVTTWTATECLALRTAYRMGQKEFAAEIGIGERYLRMWETDTYPISSTGQAGLGTLLARAAGTEIEARFDQLLGRDDDVKRREALKLGAAGALALLGLDEASERVRWLISALGRPSPAALEVMRTQLHLAMRFDDTVGSPAAHGLTAEMQQVAEAMATNSPPGMKREFQTLHAEWTALAGCLAWDAGAVKTARRLYDTARDIADEAEDDDMSAYVLCHLSQLATWERKPRAAVEHAASARGWTAQTEDMRLRAYAAMRAAEAAAIAGQPRACRAALDDAENALSGAGPCDPAESRAYFVGVGLLESYRGNCLSILGDNRAALTASQRSLDLIAPQMTRDRAVTMLEVGRMHAALGDIDGAAAAVGGAAALARENRSPRLSVAVAEGRHHLSPWAATSAVRLLDAEHFTTPDIVS